MSDNYRWASEEPTSSVAVVDSGAVISDATGEIPIVIRPGPMPLSDSQRNVLVAAIEYEDARRIADLPSSGDGYAAGRVRDAHYALMRLVGRLSRDERRRLLEAAGRTGGRV